MHSKVIKKFNPDGSSLEYLGNSVICPLSMDSELALVLGKLREELSEARWSSLFGKEALLKNSSWHMTVFICVRDKERGENVMPLEGYATELKDRSGLTGPYEEWLQYIKNSLNRIVLSPVSRPPYHLIVQKKIISIQHSIYLDLEPTTDALYIVRDQLANQTGIRHPSHGSFGFHLTLAYLLRDPNQKEVGELKEIVERHLAKAPTEVVFDTVELRSFRDMQVFHPEVIL